MNERTDWEESGGVNTHPDTVPGLVPPTGYNRKQTRHPSILPDLAITDDDKRKVTAHIRSLAAKLCCAVAPGSGNRYIGPGVTIHGSVGVQEGSLLVAVQDRVWGFSWTCPASLRDLEKRAAHGIWV